MAGEEEVCPICGRALQAEAGPVLPVVGMPAAEAPTIEMVLPDTMSYADAPRASSIAVAAPPAGPVIDLLAQGDAVVPGSSGSKETLPVAFGPAGNPVPPVLVDPHSVLIPDTSPMPAIDSSDDGLPRINESGRRPRSESEDGLDSSGGPPSWVFILLASYASALTILCVWMVLTGRVRFGAPARPSETIPADSRPDLGAPAEASRNVQMIPPLHESQITTLEQPIHAGDVELTPLTVHAGRVILRHLTRDDARAQRQGGSDALFLHLRLRNTSSSAVFAPLDESLVREHDRGLPDSLIETGQHEQIDIYPLAEHSEWAIAGQVFRELQPGEEYETDLVSAPGALEQSSDPLTWRIRLRTGPGKTDTVGVRFTVREISRDGG